MTVITRRQLHALQYAGDHAASCISVHPAESPYATGHVNSLIPSLKVKAQRSKTMKSLREVDDTELHLALVDNECRNLHALVLCIPQTSSQEDDIFFTLDMIELLLRADITTEHLRFLQNDTRLTKLQHDQGPVGTAVCQLLHGYDTSVTRPLQPITTTCATLNIYIVVFS